MARRPARAGARRAGALRRALLCAPLALLSPLAPRLTLGPGGGGALPRAYAQRSPQEAEGAVVRLLRDADSFYDNLELELMEEALEKILDIARRFGPATPRLQQDIAQAYILKAVSVSVNNPNDRAGTRGFFVKALEANPRAELDYKFSSPALQELFMEARSEATSQGYGGAPGGAPGGYGAPGGAQGGYGGPGGAQGGAQGGYGGPGGVQGGMQGGYGGPGGAPGGAQGGYGGPGGAPGGAQGGYGGPGGVQGGAQGGYGVPGGAPGGAPGGYGAGGAPGGYGAPPAAVPDIAHTPPRQLQAGAPFNVRLRVSPFLRPQVFYARLFYQTVNSNGAQRLDMRPVSDVDFEVQVPATFITGDRIQYYMVIYGQDDSPLSSYKNNREPEVAPIAAGRYGDLVGDGGLVGGGGARQSLHLTALVGTGVSVVSGEFATFNSTGQLVYDAASSDPARRPPDSFVKRTAWSPVHINLDIDFSLSDTFSLGILARAQLVNGLFETKAVSTSLLGGVQAGLRLGAASPLMLRGGAGYGYIPSNMPKTVRAGATVITSIDTTSAGPLFYKLGFSYTYQLTPLVSFRTAVDFIHLISLDTSKSAPSPHFDFNTGLVFGF